MRIQLLFGFIFCTVTAFAIPAIPPTKTVLAKNKAHDRFQETAACSPEGGCAHIYQILSIKGADSKEFTTSDTRFNVQLVGDPHAEQVTEADCRAELAELEKVLAEKKFKNVKVNFDSCSKHRREVIKILK